MRCEPGISSLPPICPVAGCKDVLHEQTCIRYGSRGYLLTHSGARLLLDHAHPITLQVDALISLLATYNPSFRLYWTTETVAHDSPWRRSRVWDGCIMHCIVPDILPFVLPALALALGLAMAWRRLRQMKKI